MIVRLRLVISCAISLLLSSFIYANDPATGKTAHWIAVDKFANTDRLSHQIELGPIQSAQLRFAGEFCRTSIAVNGHAVADIQPYCQTQLLDLTDLLRLGKNQIDLTIIPIVDTPACVAATLKVVQADGQTFSFSTDQTWTVTSSDGTVRAAQSHGLVAPELWGVGRRDISIDPFENYEQWQQAKGGQGKSPRFFVASGFEIAQLRIAQPDEGSWVSLAVDESGQLVIGREDKGFLRMSVASDGKSIAKIQPIDAELLECRGLAFHDGWLYASANNSKALFRLKLNSDGRVSDVTNLREFLGGNGHGRNDLTVAGNSLYWIFGDSVVPPGQPLQDWTSPLRKAVAGTFISEGSLLRTSFDGQQWELLSAGLRNPYGIAIHPETSDAFTYDADNEYDLGMPWYRPTRILQLIPGGDFGYRTASGQIPPRFSEQPDNAPPLIDIGRGSPTAMIFGNELQFPQPYRQALYALDWTYGRVIAVHLAPRGAGYRAATELFLQGKPLNVTDIAAGRDGAMYLITGGRKTQSALYRVSAATTNVASDTELNKSALAFETNLQSHASKQRQIARSLQSPTATLPDAKRETVLPFLEDADPVVRYSARTALEKLSMNAIASVASEASQKKVSIQALMAAARTLDGSGVATIVRRLIEIDVAALSIDQRLAWLRILELCLTANSQEVKSHQPQLEEKVIAGWQASLAPRWQIAVEGSNTDYRRRAALTLAKMNSSHLILLATRDLFASSIQEDTLTALLALRNQQAGWTPQARELQLQTLAAMPSMTGGEGLPNIHKWLERETLETLTSAEKTHYEKLKADRTTPEPLPPTRPFIQKWTIDELQAIASDPASGDVERGKVIFRDALCGRCHRFGQTGPWVGPDLTFVAGRFGRKDLLDSIINPSKSVAENYRSVVIETNDGKTLTGRLITGGDFRSEKIRLVTDALRPDQIIELDKKTIESHKDSEISPMPQGLLDTFSRESIADLLAYLTRQKSMAAR